MSLLERQLFRVTNDPEADKAFAAAQEANKKARDRVVKLYTEYYDGLSKELKIDKNSPIAKEVEADKKLLLEMIAKERDKIRNSKMTEAEIKEYESGKDMMEIQNFAKSISGPGSIRWMLLLTIKDKRVETQKQIDNLKAKGTPVPAILYANLKRLDSSEAWWKKQPVGSEPDTYAQELTSLGDDLKAGAEEAKQKTEEYQDSRETFSVWAIIGQATGIASSILGVFLLLSFGVFGASLATNLNVYKPAAFRILYAIYGFLFFFIVIPYVLLYRWWWLGKKPRFYALLPLMGKRFDNHMAGVLLGWMSFRPDDVIESLKEWE